MNVCCWPRTLKVKNFPTEGKKRAPRPLPFSEYKVAKIHEGLSGCREMCWGKRIEVPMQCRGEKWGGRIFMELGTGDCGAAVVQRIYMERGRVRTLFLGGSGNFWGSFGERSYRNLEASTLNQSSSP